MRERTYQDKSCEVQPYDIFDRVDLHKRLQAVGEDSTSPSFLFWIDRRKEEADRGTPPPKIDVL